MESQELFLILELSDDTSLKDLNVIYNIIKYIPWNEPELEEISRIRTILYSKTSGLKRNQPYLENYTPSKPIPIPKIMKKPKKRSFIPKKFRN